MDELPMICRPWNVDEVVARLLAPYLNHPGLEIPEDEPIDSQNLQAL